MSFTGMLTDEITIEKFSAEDADGWQGGETYYSPPVSYAARVDYEKGARRVILEGGKEHISNGAAVLNGDVDVDIKDRLTLPTWCSPRQPVILQIEKRPMPYGGVAVTIVRF